MLVQNTSDAARTSLEALEAAHRAMWNAGMHATPEYCRVVAAAARVRAIVKRNERAQKHAECERIGICVCGNR